jgi:hypothetical protein
MNEPAESRTLQQLEAVIESGLRTFVEVGVALMEIRERRLYREQGFTTFEDYCLERWKMSRPRAYQLMEAAYVVGNLSTIVDKPKNEAQARELAPLSPEQQREVAAGIDFKNTTAAEIRARVQELQSGGASPASVLLSIRDDVRDQLHKKFPSPAGAREIAIKTGAHTLDWNGSYQAPMTKQMQAAVREQRAHLRPLVEFLEWVGSLSPGEAQAIITERHWQSWLVGDDPTQDATVSMEYGSSWLHKLAGLLDLQGE